MIKAVLFDLDGVIVDSLYYHYLAWNKMFNDRGGSITLESVFLHEGRNSFEILPLFMKEANVVIPESEIKEFIETKRECTRRTRKQCEPARSKRGASTFRKREDHECNEL